MNTWVLNPPELFGDLSAVGGQSWQDLYAYAFEGDVEVLVLDYDKVHHLY